MIKHWRPWGAAALLGFFVWNIRGGDVEAMWNARFQEWKDPTSLMIAGTCHEEFAALVPDTGDDAWLHRSNSYVLNCAMQVKPERFCDPAVQRRLAKILRGHFANLGRVGLWDTTVALMSRDFRDSVRDAAAVEISQRDLSLTTLTIDVLRSARALTGQGYLEARHFRDMSSPLLFGMTIFAGSGQACPG